MILVVNCFIDPAFARDFDRALIRTLGEPCRCVPARELAEVGDGEAYSRLILSGSEASTTVAQPWDEALAALVRAFVQRGKPVLGLCYGHQFLAKALAGPSHVRRAPRSEFGWLKPRLEPSPLFHGLEDPEFMVCHFDEACDLPPEFRILASSDSCAIHAFQYRDLPVWGVQFHPEYGTEEATPIFAGICRGNLPAPPSDPQRLDQRRKLFENFLKA